MERDEVLDVISTRADELRRFGVRSLALFGSVARGEARGNSDVDFLVEFEGRPTFDGYVGLLCFLEDLLSCPVDLVTREGIKPGFLPRIEKDALYVVAGFRPEAGALPFRARP